MKYYVFIGVGLLLLFCMPSTIHYKKFAEMNINDEGFLTHQILQSIGISELRNDGRNFEEIQQKCFFRAETIAKERMVSMMIHTYLSLSGVKNARRNLFSSDYPEQFSKAELIYWSFVFYPILKKSFIVYKELRKNQCKAVLRIQEKYLLKQIQSIR